MNNFHDPSNTAVIVQAGYLLRTATIQGSTLALTGDINATTAIEVMGYPSSVTGVSFNQFGPSTAKNSWGVLGGVAAYTAPTISLPIFTDLVWKVIDSLPEARPDYDDSNWVNANHTTSTNPFPFVTPTSLYGSDYGFNTGNLVYRGHFTANGNEDNAGTFSVSFTGGLAFGFSVWLDDTFLGSWAGDALIESNQQTLTLLALTAGQKVNLTVLVDTMGFEEAAPIGSNAMKTPRGIMNYGLSGHANTDITWKISGNLGGEEYADKTRGPLNEGGLYAERNGCHLPNPPSGPWEESEPFDGLFGAGVYFYTTSFDLNIPAGYDVPLSFEFERTAADASATQNNRCQLYVNGYQFGKFINNIGPQYSFPVPEGVLNYSGVNYIALSLWSLSSAGSAVESLQLISTATIQSGFGTVALSPQPTWTARPGAY